jgi:hypothetical protein
MNWLMATSIFSAVMFAIIVGYDVVVAYFNDVPNSLDTISGRFRAWGGVVLLLAFAWSMLFGHFWGPLKETLMPHKVSVPILLFVGWSIFLGGMALRWAGVTITTSWILFFAVLNVGALAGALLWPQ